MTYRRTSALFLGLLLSSLPLLAQTVDPHLGSQWAIDFLHLTEAWQKVEGNAYLNVIDLGLQFNHEDLRAFPVVGPKPGNFRLHLSYDLRSIHDDPCPDEFEESSNLTGPAPCDGTMLQNPVGPGGDAVHAGHGTHVAGIAAATPDNGLGVTGACKHCSLLMSRISTNNVDIPQALYWGVDRGAQIVSGSFGIVDPAATVSCPPPPGQSAAWDQVCEALALAEQRDLVMVFAAGNNLGTIDFPARHPGAIAVGGVEQDRQVWRRNNDSGEQCPTSGSTAQCGSNFGPQLDLIAPAENIFSTAYTGKQWTLTGDCGDGSVPDGYGYCTGTSMSTPFVAGIAGLVRSANPLLTRQNVYDILTRSADLWPNRNDLEGYGVPNARTAVDLALGLAPDRPLANRLTPLFSFYSPATEDHLYTAVPQVASSAVSGLLHGSCTSVSRQDCPTTWVYQSVGPSVPGYAAFPGVPPCNVSPCFENTPRASVYVFTSEKIPYAGAPALVPLYRMTFKGPQDHIDTTYTTSVDGLNAFRGVGYELDGIEGYIFPRCTPEPGCRPAGTVPLYRRYHPQRDDFAIFPESELAQMVSQGYTSTGGTNLNEVIGYVYPNADGDLDGVINGFEGLIGTDAARADSDCDGLSDGTESLGYPYTDPLGGPGCSIFADVPANHWARSFIETIYHEGVTAGCVTNPLRYCPDAQVTRASMAVFLLRAKFGSSYQPPPATCNPLRFADVPCGYWAAAWIEELADQGVTAGCGSGNYCPEGLVDRSQMAIFLLRALEGINYVPPAADCNAPRFTDVPCTHWASAWIEELAKRGVTTGCTANTYCPADIVNRASMAVFLVRTFDF